MPLCNMYKDEVSNTTSTWVVLWISNYVYIWKHLFYAYIIIFFTLWSRDLYFSSIYNSTQTPLFKLMTAIEISLVLINNYRNNAIHINTVEIDGYLIVPMTRAVIW